MSVRKKSALRRNKYKLDTVKTEVVLMGTSEPPKANTWVVLIYFGLMLRIGLAFEAALHGNTTVKVGV